MAVGKKEFPGRGGAMKMPRIVNYYLNFSVSLRLTVLCLCYTIALFVVDYYSRLSQSTHAIFITVIVILGGMFGWLNIWSIHQAIARASKYLRAIADGDLNQEITIHRHNEISHMLTCMRTLQESVQRLSADTVMLTSAAVNGDLATRVSPDRHRGDFREIVKGINATMDAVIAPLNIASGALHKLGSGKMAYEVIGEFRGDYQKIKTGVNSLVNAIKKRNEDLELLSDAVSRGNLTLRADTTRYSGYHLKTVRIVNEILDRLIDPLNLAATYVDRISKGDIPPKITDVYHGDFNVIKNNLNSCIDIMNNLLSETHRVVLAAAEGRLDERTDVELFVGGWKQLVLSVNDIVTNIVNPLRQTAQLLNIEVAQRREAQETQLLQQQELELLNFELEARVAEEVKKNREKDQALMQGEKMASLGQLAAGVAHEINNPMAYIAGNMSILAEYFEAILQFDRILQEKCDSEALREDLERSRKLLKIEYILTDVPVLIAESLDGTARVTQIVQDLKSFSRMDTLEKEPVKLESCIERALTICFNELKYVALIRKEYGHVPLVLCHPGKLNQVFLNLLVNAGQAMAPRGEILLRTWYDEAFVYATVSDTGKGIPEDLLPRIFEPFFTTKSEGKGTGLGLSISYDIIKKHAGELLVESVVGEGTTFTVKLPRTDEEAIER